MTALNTPPAFHPLFTYLGTQQNSVVADGELIVVNFAGIGGACEGLQKALRRPVTHAINHNPTAISLHRVNSPYTTHHIQDVWQVDPEQLAGGRRIAVAWFSPDCKHFSRAKGGKPVEKGIRDLGWVTTKYTGLPDHIKPRIVFLENVEEFADWGPLDAEDRPDKARKGETFREFVRVIESHGYEVQHRLLKACDYGAPTTRKRLFLIARCDGEPIVWPRPTHGHPDSPAVRSGQLLPWRTAAECIDWDLPTNSIFDRKKPLVDNTMRRVARGLKKYVKESAQPYIVTCNHGGAGFRGQGLDEPLRTITAAYDATGVVDPLVTPYLINKQHKNEPRPVTAPLSTITTNQSKNELAAAVLVQSGHYSNITGEGSHFRGQSVTRPLSTITASGTNNMLTLAHLTKFRQSSVGVGLDEPMHTITAGAPRTGTGAAHGLVTANLISFYGFKTPTDTRGQGMDTPLKTQTTENRHGLMTASLIKHFGGHYTGSGVDLNRPMDTVTAVDHHALLACSLVKHAPHAGPDSEQPGLTCATLVRQFGTSRAADIGKPLGTIVSQGGGKTHLVCADLVPGLTEGQTAKARQVYDLMVRFAPDALTERDHVHRLVLVVVNGTEYIIEDVMMRMLSPRELARGQSFDDSYELETGANGETITKTAQVNGIGNSVCPIVAQRLAEANVPGFRNAAD